MLPKQAGGPPGLQGVRVSGGGSRGWWGRRGRQGGDEVIQGGQERQQELRGRHRAAQGSQRGQGLLGRAAEGVVGPREGGDRR